MQVATFLVNAFLWVHSAQWLAVRRRRSATVWMWAVALLGPVPLAVLACMPQRKDAASHV
jgi:hypothetical protein